MKLKAEIVQEAVVECMERSEGKGMIILSKEAAQILGKADELPMIFAVMEALEGVTVGFYTL